MDDVVSSAELRAEMRAELTELRSEIARLRSALAPIADIARDRCAFDPAWKPTSSITCSLLIGDLRAAAMCFPEHGDFGI